MRQFISELAAECRIVGNLKPLKASFKDFVSRNLEIIFAPFG